jgi:hypothetical protein
LTPWEISSQTKSNFQKIISFNRKHLRQANNKFCFVCERRREERKPLSFSCSLSPAPLWWLFQVKKWEKLWKDEDLSRKQIQIYSFSLFEADKLLSLG